MRILVVNWQDRENPQSGGAEIHLHETFGRIVGLGHQVDVLCSGWKGSSSTVLLDGMRILESDHETERDDYSPLWLLSG